MALHLGWAGHRYSLELSANSKAGQSTGFRRGHPLPTLERPRDLVALGLQVGAWEEEERVVAFPITSQCQLPRPGTRPDCFLLLASFSP